MKQLLASLSLILSLGLSVPGPAQASEAPVSFAGRRITLFIGFSAIGGIGYDTYGRVMARYLGKYLPGHPLVIAENKPGAGSMILANYLYNSAPKDGSEIGVIGRGVAMDRLLYGDTSSARFDATKFNWLGSMNNEVSGFFISDRAPVRNLQDILAGHELVVGSNGAGSDPTIFTLTLNALLGTRLKLIPAYPGMNEILLAMESGELDGVAGYSWGSARGGSARQLQDGKLKLVMQMALQKHPDLPEIPLIMDLVKSAADRQVLQLIFARQSMGRPFVAPPGLAPPIVAALRTGFAAAMSDPALIADCAKLDMEINFVPGEQIATLVQSLYAFSPEVVAQAQKAVTPP